MPKCLQCGNWESVTASHCSRCGSLMPPSDRRSQVQPEIAAAREARRERRRKAYEERDRPPTPQEARAATRRLVMEAIGCLMPIPAVAAVAGVAVVIAGEAIPVALVATVAGTITGWLMIPVLVFVSENCGEYRGAAGKVIDWADPYLALGAAVGVTLLVSLLL